MGKLMFAIEPISKNYRINLTKSTNNKLVSYAKPIILSNIITTLPAHAEGKVFDFNATLPAMAAQFLLLMLFLEKTWFGPVGKVLDERDAKIRARLSSVKTGDDELETLAKESADLLKEARSEAQNKIAEARSKAAAKAAAELTAEKNKLDDEIAQSVKS